MKYLIVFAALMLSSCITMPAQVTSYDSKADNVHHVEVEPGWVGSSTIKLGLHKVSSMPADEVVMIVATKGDIARTQDGLTINIDGEKKMFSSMDAMTDIDQNQFFTKRFVVKLDYVKKMVAGKNVWVKVAFNGQTSMEGEFSAEHMMSAKSGFKAFLMELSKQK